MPSFSAFCLIDPSVRFMTFAIFFTGVLARECARNSLTCSLVYGTRTGFLAVLGTMVPMVDGDNAYLAEDALVATACYNLYHY